MIAWMVLCGSSQRWSLFYIIVCVITCRKLAGTGCGRCDSMPAVLCDPSQTLLLSDFTIFFLPAFGQPCKKSKHDFHIVRALLAR